MGERFTVLVSGRIRSTVELKLVGNVSPDGDVEAIDAINLGG
jgi:hypothetical protein